MAKFNINSKPKASLKNKNTIKFNMFEGALTGNIFDVVVDTGTCEISLDFSCSDNSQYIGVI
jgi:hypothetical protein